MALTHSFYRRRAVLDTSTGNYCTGKSYNRRTHIPAKMASRKRKRQGNDSPSAAGNGKTILEMPTRDATGTVYAQDRATEFEPRQANDKAHHTHYPKPMAIHSRPSTGRTTFKFLIDNAHEDLLFKADV